MGRAQALERMGITRWRLRSSLPAAAPDAPSGPVTAAAPAPERALESARAPGALESGANKASPVAVPTAAPAAGPDSVPASIPVPADEGLSLRARLLSGASAAPFFVLACSEGRARDARLDLHQESGRLLAAMLATLPATGSVALLGADNGDRVQVGSVLLLLGERTAKTVLGPEVKAPWRGRVHRVGGVLAVCSYHPDELWQNASLKPLAWDDLCLLASLLPSRS